MAASGRLRPLEWRTRLAGRWLILSCACLCGDAPSVPGLEPVTIRSQSGQFIVRGLPMGAPVSGYSTSTVNYLRLDPTLTAVSLERIRHAVLAELGLPEKWRGLITVSTQPVQEDDPTVRVASVHYPEGWGYRVALPERIDKERFIRVAVEVILIEIANRNAGAREAELPPWLAEGLSAELQATALATLALEPETRVMTRERNADPMRGTREVLRRRPALNFDDLCMPMAEHRTGANAELYRACSQLFVHELLRLRGGRDCLRDMLVRLPENLNWQTTFLRAFANHFSRLIDADKWYALNAAHLSGRDPMSRMPSEAAWQQIEQILGTQVQVRLDASELPMSTTVSLQRVIAEWNFPRQQPVLMEKARQLQALRTRTAPNVGELADAYARTLQSYAGGRRPRGTASVLRQLDDLDARRQTLRERVKTAVVAP